MGVNFDYIANPYVELLIDTATAAGMDREILLQTAQLDASDLATIGGVTALPKFCSLIDIVTERNPSIGIEFGRTVNITISGKVAELLMSAATLWDAGMYAYRFLPLMDLPVSVDIKQVDFRIVAGLRFSPYCKAVSRRRFFAEFNLVSWLQHIKCLIRDDYQFERLELDFAKPSYGNKYENIFACPIHYNCNENKIFFSRHSLNKPVVSANPVVEKLVRTSCTEMLKKKFNGCGISDQISQLLLLNDRIRTLEQVASQLNLATRTVRKRLHQENSSFRHILQCVKQERACSFLNNRHKTVGEVARLLGYNDTANFRRAFKSWMGMSPSAYAKKGGAANRPSV